MTTATLEPMTKPQTPATEWRPAVWYLPRMMCDRQLAPWFPITEINGGMLLSFGPASGRSPAQDSNQRRALLEGLQQEYQRRTADAATAADLAGWKELTKELAPLPRQLQIGEAAVEEAGARLRRVGLDKTSTPAMVAAAEEAKKQAEKELVLLRQRYDQTLKREEKTRRDYQLSIEGAAQTVVDAVRSELKREVDKLMAQIVARLSEGGELDRLSELSVLLASDHRGAAREISQRLLTAAQLEIGNE